MASYLLRRILIAFPVLLGVTIVSSVALSLAPGDPLTARLDPAQLQELQRNPARLEERRRELGLDQPVPIRYSSGSAGRSRATSGTPSNRTGPSPRRSGNGSRRPLRSWAPPS